MSAIIKTNQLNKNATNTGEKYIDYSDVMANSYETGDWPTVYQHSPSWDIEGGDDSNLYFGLEVEIPEESLPKTDEELATEPSDIEGMTKLDKKNAGLNYKDGSDTDHDRLTDKEEIEIYHSDPLKMSTAGDLYKDSYKVEHDMDLFTYYEYPEEDMTFDYNHCADEITLVPALPSDFGAQVDHGMYYIDLDGVNELCVYNVLNFGGQVKIDLSQYADSIDLNSLSVWCTDVYMDKTEECMFTLEGNTMIPNVPIERSFEFWGTFIVVGFKSDSSVSGTVQQLLVNAAETVQGSTKDKAKILVIYGDAYALICHFLLRDEYTGYPYVYIVKGEDEEDNQLALQQVVSFYHMTNNRRDYSKWPITEGKDYCYIDEETYKKRLRIVNMVASAHSANITEYKNYEQLGGYLDDTIYLTRDEFTELEDPYLYEVHRFRCNASYQFPFANFGTTVSPGGVCAGITHYISTLYHNGEIPLYGSYTFLNGETCEWDLTSNALLDVTTPGRASGFETASFPEEHSCLLDPNNPSSASVVAKDLEPYQQEFIDMLNSYWEEDNLVCDRQKYVKTQEDIGYNWELVEKMIEYLDNDHVLDCSFTLWNKEYVKREYAKKAEAEARGESYTIRTPGHAINIVGYTRTYDDGDAVVFNLLDSNYPKGIGSDGKRRNTTITFKKMHNEEYDVDTIYYMYDVSDILVIDNRCKSSDSTKITSDEQYMNSYFMVIMDEEYNVLNDMVEDFDKTRR